MNPKTTKVARTKLKFVESQATGEMIAYVTICSKTGQLFGVKAEDPRPKKIVLVSKDVSKKTNIKTKTLYDVELVTMGAHESRKSCKGFIVTRLKHAKFKADVFITQDGVVHVQFGNKDILFDPSSPKENIHDKSLVAKHLLSRPDLLDKDNVIEVFLKLAQEVTEDYSNKYNSKISQLQSKYEDTKIAS